MNARPPPPPPPPYTHIPQTLPSDNRQIYLDVAKGIVILFVVVVHIPYGHTPLLTWIGSFYMPFFFFISGVTLAASPGWKAQGLKRNLFRTSVRLLYPYVIFSLLSAVFCLIAECLWGIETDYKDLLFRSVIGEGYLTLWFLPAIWISRCCFFLFYRYRLLKWYTICGIALLTLWAARFVLIECPLRSEYLWLNITREITFVNRGLVGFVFLAVGYFINAPIQRLCTRFPASSMKYQLAGGTSFVALLLLSASLCQINGGVNLGYGILKNGVLFYIFAFSSSIAFVLFVKYCLPNQRFFAFWGRNSLTVMCTHLNVCVLTLIHITLEKFPLLVRGTAAWGHIFIALALLIEYLLIRLINGKLPFLIKCPVRIERWLQSFLQQKKRVESG